MNAGWLHPEWIPVSAAILLLATTCVVFSWGRARRRAQRLIGSAASVGPRRLLRDLALVAALAAVVVAALGPRVGTRTVWVPSAGVDVVLLLDVSRSMNAADVAPTRLARARRAAEGLLRGLGTGDRAALVAFASRGVVLTPLTPDHDALLEVLAAVDGNLFQKTGSRLARGVAAATSAFEARSERPRIVVVLSDGEAPRRSRDVGVAVAREAGTRIVALGIGSERGAPILEGGVALRDGSGNVVISRRDLGRLQQLTEACDGTTFAADDWGDVDLDAALSVIRRDAGEVPGELVARQIPAVLVFPCVAVAFLLLFLETAGPALRTARSAATGTVAVALLAVLIGSGDAVAWFESQLRERPGDPKLLIALGVARAESGDQAAAGRALEAAALGATKPDLASMAYYDLGVLELDRGDYARARDAFLDALALRPGDRRARFNLEWTLRALDATPPPTPPAPAGANTTEPDAAEPDEAKNDTRPDRPERKADTESQPSASDERPQDAASWAPELQEDEVRRWLDAVGDESGRALRLRTQEAGDSATAHSGGPRW